MVIILHKFHEEIDTLTVHKEIYFKSRLYGTNRPGVEPTGWCKGRNGKRRRCGSLYFAILFGNP